MPSILIADDTEAVLTVLHDAFTALGFTTVLARNGQEALTLFCLHQPDLIILDMLMPHTEGLETIISIREVNTTVPIVAISGAYIGTYTDLLQLAIAVGANRAIRKPFIVTELRESIVKEYFPKHTIPPRP